MTKPVVLSENELLTNDGQRVPPAALQASPQYGTSPPTASSTNEGEQFFDTDRKGGTLYQVQGAALVQIAPGVEVETAWTPARLDNLRLFLLADDNTGADNTSVSAWVDQKNGWSFAQGTAGKQPKLYTTTAARLINNQPVVTFDGTNDLLVYTAAAPITDASGSIFAVWRPTPTGSTNQALFSSSDTAGSTRHFNVGIDMSVTPARVALTQRDAGTTNAIYGPVWRRGTPVFSEWRSTGSAYRMRRDLRSYAVTASTGSDNGAWFSGVTGPDNLVVGGRVVDSEAAQMSLDLAALIVVASITDGERALLADWVAGKYGLAPAGRVVDSGQVTLGGGTATVTAPHTTSTSDIYYSIVTPGGTPGWLQISTYTPGTSFVLTSSSGTDTSTVAWRVEEPVA